MFRRFDARRPTRRPWPQAFRRLWEIRGRRCGLRLPLACLLLFWVVAGCSRLAPPGPGQALVVGLPANPLFQQQANPTEGMEGFSRDITRMFAARLGSDVRYIVAADDAELRKLVQTGRVHFAAATPVRRDEDAQLRYSPPLRTTRQVVVQHADTLPVAGLAGLAGREISVMPGAPQIATLLGLGLNPAPVPVERANLDELELLERAARRRELAATDDLHYAVAVNFHPGLIIAVELPATLDYAWAFAPRFDALREQAGEFIEELRKDGTLRRLDDRYFGHIRRIARSDIGVFLARVRTHLPDFRTYFQEAQEETGIDWRLLAALAYQESKWEPLASSPTGVRGMMMLTEDTADRLGVTNRLDPRQSIRAGARYLAMLMDELPPEIGHPDRLWFALAAYNLGMGHLRGGRAFAPGLNRDPNSWVDMKQVLPLMARPEYYERLKSGRARGGEAVILVENVRTYYDVLARLEPSYTPPSLGGRSAPMPHRRLRTARNP